MNLVTLVVAISDLNFYHLILLISLVKIRC